MMELKLQSLYFYFDANLTYPINLDTFIVKENNTYIQG